MLKELINQSTENCPHYKISEARCDDYESDNYLSFLMSASNFWRKESKNDQKSDLLDIFFILMVIHNLFCQLSVLNSTCCWNSLIHSGWNVFGCANGWIYKTVGIRENPCFSPSFINLIMSVHFHLEQDLRSFSMRSRFFFSKCWTWCSPRWSQLYHVRNDHCI